VLWLLKNDNNNYKFSIDKFYKNYLKGPRIFNNRDALEPSYIPHELPHRDVQIKDIAEKTACALFGDAPPSFLCYGQTGTGKTATIRYISQKLAQQNTEIKPWWVYINCNVVTTPYRILAHVYNTISRDEKIPPTGLPKDIIFKRLLGLLDSKVRNSICFLVLDEIDILIDKKGGNEILYDLTRLNENLDRCKTSLIGISNKLKFRDCLDPRILSSLGEEYIVFPSYDAGELRDILTKRAIIAFHESVLKEDVIPLCAAIAAKEHGDARKALQLLRKAGELAERAQSKSVNSKYVEKAQDDLEKDHIMEYIKGMPLQAQLVLTAVYLISKYSSDHIITSGDIYEVHSEIRGLIPGVRQLTKRRISDYISELTLAGIISAEVKSMGHYGRTKIIKLDIGLDIIEKVLSGIDKIQAILSHKPTILQTDKVKLKNNIFKKLI
jgi:cell division control protein 6